MTAEHEPCVFRREGEYWTVVFAGVTCRMRDTAGLRHVACLLRCPNQRLAAIDLVTMVEDAVPGEDVSAADDESPPIDHRHAEERARVRVTHAIRHALERLAMYNAALNEHLRATIKTGKYCVYRADPRRGVAWSL